MIEIGRYAYMLFDGDCGICTSFSKIAKRVDTKKYFVVKPYQMFSPQELNPLRITYEKCAKKIHVITYKGHIYTGAFALNYFFIHYFPWSLLIVLLYAIPIFLLLEIIWYAVVAKNRHHISRLFGFKACVLNRRS